MNISDILLNALIIILISVTIGVNAYGLKQNRLITKERYDRFKISDDSTCKKYLNETKSMVSVNKYAMIIGGIVGALLYIIFWIIRGYNHSLSITTIYLITILSSIFSWAASYKIINCLLYRNICAEFWCR